MGEKTEQPTGRKLSEARNRGNLGKSQDLSAALMMIAVIVTLIFFARPVLEGMMLLLRYLLAPTTVAESLRVADLAGDLRISVLQIVRLVAPMMLVMFAVAYIANFLQVGWLLTLKPIQPNLGKLNIVKGAAKFFSKRSLIKGAIDLVKLLVVIGLAWLVVNGQYHRIVALAGLPLLDAVFEAAEIVLEVSIWVLLLLLILGIADFAYQKWQNKDELKMTKQEVKDERKSSEGDMEMKARRLRQARQIAMQRIQSAVPDADVIVTNPTHFAVALKYDQETMAAPKLLAKGADLLALRIRQVAAAHGVPIVERPPLARAIYKDIEIGQEVHPDHYEAVAEVLAYVYRLNERVAS